MMHYRVLGLMAAIMASHAFASVVTCEKGVNFANPATYANVAGGVTCRYEDGTLARKATIASGDVIGMQYYTQTGVLYAEDQLKNGTKHGICKRFYDTNGALKEVQSFENDRPVGVATGYQPDGKTLASLKDDASASSVMFNAQGKPTSIYCGKPFPPAFSAYCKSPVQLYTATGEKDRMFVPEGSRFSGTLRDTDDNGTPASEAAYKDGKRDGQVISRDTKGRITKINTYKNGELSGEQVVYYGDSDQIKERYQYDAANQKKVESQEFYQNGKLKSAKQYVKPDTFTMKRYYDTGNLQSEATLVENGQCNGDYCFDKVLDGAMTYSKKGSYKVHYYDAKGNVAKVEKFEANGKRISTKEYYPDGSQKR